VLSAANLFGSKKQKGDSDEVSSAGGLSRSTSKLWNLKDGKDKKGRPASKTGKATASVESTVVTVSLCTIHDSKLLLV